MAKPFSGRLGAITAIQYTKKILHVSGCGQNTNAFSTQQRLQRLRKADMTLTPSQNGSSFKRNLAHWQNKDSVYPDNVLYLGTESHNQHHSAVFPQTLPTWFIRLFTQEQDIVLDPFIGSGTTAVAAHQLGRQFIGIDISEEYCQIARNRLNKIDGALSVVNDDHG